MVTGSAARATTVAIAAAGVETSGPGLGLRPAAQAKPVRPRADFGALAKVLAGVARRRLAWSARLRHHDIFRFRRGACPVADVDHTIS